MYQIEGLNVKYVSFTLFEDIGKGIPFSSVLFLIMLYS